MPPKRRSETICDSTLLTMAVVVPVAVSLYLYRREPKKLFQILFGVFVSFMVFVMLKHLWKIVSARWKSKEEDVNPGLSHMLISKHELPAYVYVLNGYSMRSSVL